MIRNLWQELKKFPIVLLFLAFLFCFLLGSAAGFSFLGCSDFCSGDGSSFTRSAKLTFSLSSPKYAQKHFSRSSTYRRVMYFQPCSVWYFPSTFLCRTSITANVPLSSSFRALCAVWHTAYLEPSEMEAAFTKDSVSYTSSGVNESSVM